MRLFGALEAGGTKMVCAIGTEDGQILSRISLPTRDPATTVPEMLAYFRQYDLSAIGIGCFGPIDLNKHSQTYGYITSTPKLAWQDYPIVRAFTDGLGIPVGFDTDVNAAALGESVYGCCRDVSNSIYITIGTGVGVGVIIGKQPHHGMLHPEGGHIFLAPHPEDPMQVGVCPFHRNCLEGYASGPAVEKRWGKKGADLADEGKVWELEAYYIAQAICSYIMILSPERIVLGGGIMHQQQLLPLIRQQVAAQMAGYIRCPQMDDLESYIVGASLADNQGILGCIQLAANAEGNKYEQKDS